ncbi:MAG: hypothetical protein RJA36_3574 [Pseudomonadota bacterium]
MKRVLLFPWRALAVLVSLVAMLVAGIAWSIVIIADNVFGKAPGEE